MKCYILTTPIGIFALDENKKIIDKIIFGKNPNKVASILNSKELTEEELNLIKRLKDKGFDRFVLGKKINNYDYEENNIVERDLRKKIRSLAKEYFDDLSFNEFLTEVGIELTKIRIKTNVKKDRIVMEVIDAIDEIDKSLNVYIARLREWYGLHFPELEQNVSKHEKFVKLIATYGLRNNIKEKDFLDLARESMGIELNEKDEEILKEYSSLILSLYKLRENMEKYLENVLKEFAPNFSAIAGPLLAARLINLAGGFDKLAKKPSSTIQLLGAEKALFRYLHGQGRSPKHGVLFTHNLIQQAPQSKRGKVARIIASKLSIAIKMDYYGSEDKSEELKKELKERIDKILREG
ncbi:MAG: C/D box methylation guide ribonucleoprotein complex aNOP56 subunit [Candidatus Aenigmatarchaeota archaeon]